MDYVNFIITDFEGIYHAILGRLGIAKFMAVPHYGYLVLKIPTEKGILPLRGNVLMAHSCETNAYAAAKIADLKARLEGTTLEDTPASKSSTPGKQNKHFDPKNRKTAST